ncbi:MAG: hypothetical protein ABI723_14760 [Bacteroidia bacterium]
MLKNKKRVTIVIAMFTLAVVVISGCEKNTTVIIPVKSAEVTKTVSFSKDLVPIFTSKCASIGCHPAGGYAPVLTADQAYASLINGNYVNKSSPESSKVYRQLTGDITPAMPLGSPANPSNIEGLILAWIKQGAKKN